MQLCALMLATALVVFVAGEPPLRLEKETTSLIADFMTLEADVDALVGDKKALEEDEVPGVGPILDYNAFKLRLIALTGRNIADLINLNYLYLIQKFKIEPSPIADCCCVQPGAAVAALTGPGGSEDTLYEHDQQMNQADCSREDPAWANYVQAVRDFAPTYQAWNLAALQLGLNDNFNRNQQNVWFRKPGVSSAVYSVFATLARDLPGLFNAMYLENGCTVINLFDGRHGGKWGTYLDAYPWDPAATTAPLQEDFMFRESQHALDRDMKVIRSDNIRARGRLNPAHVKKIVDVSNDASFETRVQVNMYNAADWSVPHLREVKDHVRALGHQQSCTVIGWCYSFATFRQHYAPDEEAVARLGAMRYTVDLVDAFVAGL